MRRTICLALGLTLALLSGTQAGPISTPAPASGRAVATRPRDLVLDAHDWDKNAPHPESVTKGKPYVLPGWTGETFRSLKELGLDTATPGTYTITGVYQENPTDEPPKSPVATWAGTARSNTIRVEVKD